MKTDQGAADGITQPLLLWYDNNKRSLPWRETKDPYRIWVSEIMLQQTRVEAVRGYYQRFLEALPDIGALARAEEPYLLKLWEGLGYYNRVRNMQKAAIRVMEEYEGRMPDCYELLLSLPGIGEYTAGAIASIAFDRVAPAVDGNVLRILARLWGDASDIADPGVKKAFAKRLLAYIPQDRPGDFNQALIELGAVVCVPNGKPKCGECPWREICIAKKEERTDLLPVKSKKKERSIEKKTVLLILDGSHVLLHKRPKSGLLAGMYEFPMADGWISAARAKEMTAELGLSPLRIRKSTEAVHIFTHKEWHMHSYLVTVADTMPEAKAKKTPWQEYVLIPPGELDKTYPLPSAFKAFRHIIG
ncbi:MAG: A/G-specific adenine glycosylase [Lachnospiraceae bacterium]|nr:A/G-specific adenine glycosylase [Lachnospiraceae bacterium]